MSIYNGAKYLREAVDSVLNQTFTDFEFIIVNDGSTDTTADILSSYTDPRIKIITNTKNLGLTKSLNIGLKIARGEYIARQDADDISLLHRLSTQHGFMKKHPHLAALGGWAEFIDSHNRITGSRRPPTNPDIIKFSLISFHNAAIHPTLMLRLSAIKQVGFYNEKFVLAQDFDLCSRLALNGFIIQNLPKIFIQKRRHSEAIGQKKIVQQNFFARQIIARNLRLFMPLSNRSFSALYNGINRRHNTVINALYALWLWRQFFHSYCRQEKPSPEELKKVMPLYRSSRRSIIKSLFI